MNIELKEITIRELTEGYDDKGENGVVGYNGKLDIRPPYQREFIYKDKQRDAVIDSVVKGFPLNTMYWAVRDDGTFELIDGQQRTISICQYVNGDFAHNLRYFHNLKKDEKEKILDYRLQVYLCTGTESEKLEWFKTINIATMKLTDQELRNAVYSGPWVSDAKKYFSKNGCVASKIAADYVSGSPIRQEILETAIDWISKGNIDNYMGVHQHDPNASALWIYFQSVMSWVAATFPVKRRFMKSVNWGALYDDFKGQILDAKVLEDRVKALLLDDDVTNKSGIYPYVLTGEEKYLNIRAFSEAMRIKAYEKQKGKCAICKKTFTIEEMEADHIIPWHDGGKTDEKNCQMLCRECNRHKSGK